MKLYAWTHCSSAYGSHPPLYPKPFLITWPDMEVSSFHWFFRICSHAFSYLLTHSFIHSLTHSVSLLKVWQNWDACISKYKTLKFKKKTTYFGHSTTQTDVPHLVAYCPLPQWSYWFYDTLVTLFCSAGFHTVLQSLSSLNPPCFQILHHWVVWFFH